MSSSFPESDKPRLYVDRREEESGVPELLKELGCEVRMKSLPVGDYILSDRVGVERKTRSDFEESIIDGRLFQQMERLSNAFEIPLLIVEGERSIGRIRREAFIGAVSAIILDFRASVFFTRDSERTAQFLYSVAKREQILEKRPLRVKGDKRAYTISQYQRMIVESLPGIGPKLAKELLRRFGTVERVMTADKRELKEVEKIGEEKARRIRRILTLPYDE